MVFMDATVWIAIIGSILGSGGITAFVTTILSARKYKAEANQIEQESRKEMDKYVNEKLKEVTEMYIKETKELKESNDNLNKQINELQNKLQEIMSWIIYDNQNYRLWLETELRKVNPSIDFPRCSPPPKIYRDGSDEQIRLEESVLHHSTNENHA